MALDDDEVSSRLEYLRGERRAGALSYGELAELQGLAEHIPPGDVELLEAAGVPEHEPPPDTSPWMICPTCRGDGKHSQHLGAITQEDRDRDWDPDAWQDYLDGVYDKTCETCGGSGKIRQKAYDAICERRAEYASENHHRFEPGY